MSALANMQLAATTRRLSELKRVVDLPLLNGGTFTWTYIDPLKLMSAVVQECPGVRAAYTEAARRSPPGPGTPWRMIVGFDEFMPGNKLSLQKSRKTMVVSFTFAELGQAAVTNGIMWHTAVTIRASVIGKIRGGFPTVLREFLSHILFSSSGLRTGGVCLELTSGPTLVFARLANLLSDGDGLRQAFDWVGASGLKPCLKHWNVFKKGSDLANRRPGCVEISCSDPSQFKPWAPVDLASSVDRICAVAGHVAARTMAKIRLTEMEQAVGFPPEP